MFQPAAADTHEDAVLAYKRGDYANALGLWQPLAEQGDPRAQHNIGILFRDGRGVTRDYAIALQWFRKAAEQGLPIAQYNLGAMYGNGWGAPRDYIQAYMWFSLAAARFTASDKASRERALTNRERAAAQLTRAQIAQAERLAREWRPNRERR